MIFFYAQGHLYFNQFLIYGINLDRIHHSDYQTLTLINELCEKEIGPQRKLRREMTFNLHGGLNSLQPQS